MPKATLLSALEHKPSTNTLNGIFKVKKGLAPKILGVC